MQKTIRILRVVLPVIFLGFIALIAASYSQNIRRTAVVGGQVEPAVRPGDRPSVVSYTFEDTQTVGGRVVSRIRARRTTGFESGWYTLEDAQLTVFRKGGGHYELVAPLAQFKATTKEAEIRGGVRLTSSDGIEILTSEIRFDGERIANRIPVEFKVDQWHGRAGGVDLNVNEEKLRLWDTLTAEMKPRNPAEAPMTVRASEAIFNRKAHDVNFNENVSVQRTPDSLTCNKIIVRFDDRDEVMIELKGEGDVVVNLSPGSAVAGGTASSGGEKKIEADRWFSDLGPQGEIRAITAVGEQGPARGYLAGPPRRTLTSQWIRVALENSRLTELKADLGVVLEENAPAGTKTLRSAQMFVHFDPNTREATNALLQGGLDYRDAKVTATADRGNYDIGGDKMVLTPAAGALVTIVSDRNTLRGSMVEFSNREGTMKVSGNVSATLVSSDANASASSTSVFPTNTPVYVNADTGIFRQANRTAYFSGNVRAWQELNTLLANELSVQGAGDQLQARKAVKLVLYNRGRETKPPANRVPVVATSDALLAKKTERRIEMTGNVRVEEMTRVLETEKATLFFNAARKLERLEADGKVAVSDKATSRKGTADKASYRVTEQILYMDGTPAELIEPRGTLRGQQIVYDMARNKAVVASGSAPSESTYKPD
jgi:lipopolysaccharide transport protein LptA